MVCAEVAWLVMDCRRGGTGAVYTTMMEEMRSGIFVIPA
jgi:hypothetical protein